MIGPTADADRLVLEAADARLEVRPLDGGRISSLVVRGSELLRSRAEGGGPILPWDDCFTGLRSAPRLTWPGVLGLELTSSCDHWVVYDEPRDAVCVEPQTAPPDFVTVAPSTTVPGEPLVATMTWRWWALD